MNAKDVIGIDLGTSKSGVCWISGVDVVHLQTVQTENLLAFLTQAEQDCRCPTTVVVDAPINPGVGGGFRLIDRVFMRGHFNNNHVGLQPNNPDLLNMMGVLQPLIEWCEARGILYSNEFPVPGDRGLRETMPNVALGMLTAPATLLQMKRRLRFRYGRGANVAPITVAFESLGEGPVPLFAPLRNAPTTWVDLEAVPQGVQGEQADDLIAGLVCAALAWWQANSDVVGYVKGEQGHYLLPPLHMIHPDWLAELRRILVNEDFALIDSNMVHDRRVEG